MGAVGWISRCLGNLASLLRFDLPMLGLSILILLMSVMEATPAVFDPEGTGLVKGATQWVAIRGCLTAGKYHLAMDRLMWWYEEFPMQVMKEEQGVLLIRPPPEPPSWSDRERPRFGGR
ncbi:unnamed protein product [Cuscuta epithymum]|uniref:Uncharacterized protein n=1 Tax=Cuscuta epithymum TaxID=186058 RepID=A0AAV0D4F8_9ASTE|nr:unnamed protein product [Cuscuta epithymum]